MRAPLFQWGFGAIQACMSTWFSGGGPETWERYLWWKCWTHPFAAPSYSWMSKASSASMSRWFSGGGGGPESRERYLWWKFWTHPFVATSWASGGGPGSQGRHHCWKWWAIPSSSPEASPVEGRAKNKSSQAVDMETIQSGCPGKDKNEKRCAPTPGQSVGPKAPSLDGGNRPDHLSWKVRPDQSAQYSSHGAEDFILPQSPTTVVTDGTFGKWTH